MKIIEPAKLKNVSRTDFTSLMIKRIRKILMICSSYDAYILEEDGQIESQLQKEYGELNLSSPPTFTWVNSSEDAELLLKQDSDFDLIICMFNLRDMDLFDFAQKFKASGNDIPIVLLTNYSKEFFRRLEDTDHSAIDYIFTWHGNADLIMAIVKLIEDRMNADNDILEVGVQCILLVEDSIRFYSTYLPAIYKLLLKQGAEFLKEAMNEQQKKMRKRARPKIILATNYEDAVIAYQKYKSNMLGVISDVGFVLHKNDTPELEKLDAGIELCKMIQKDNPQIPIILQSSQSSVQNIADEMNVGFLQKNSKTLLLKLANYISEEFVFGDFIVRDLDTKEEISRASNLKELQNLIKEIPERELIDLASRNRLSKWLFSRGLFTIARQIRDVTPTQFESCGEIREYLTEHIKEYRILTGQGIIAGFDKNTYNKYIWFAKLGEGSIGGKARGLAFLNNVVMKYNLYSKFEGLHITIPRTIVIATDYFDEFIVNNGLQYVIDADVSDEEILSEFVSSSLSEDLMSQLRAFVDTIKTPLAVRSSSKLEDSHFQPFAGIYSTYMIPYTENRDQMVRLLSKAIKSVYASVYYASSRAYIQTTANLLGEEKMAVVIQGICGSEDQGYYFPAISGVARSVNYYPIGSEDPEDGIVNMAFGLGKLVVEGGKTLRFSPKNPKKILQLSTVDLALNDTQTEMYALDLKPEEFKTSINDGINIQKFSISESSRFDSIKHVASTWDMINQRLVPNTFEEGRRVITFARILEYDTLPVSEAISILLNICKEELRCPVEIEFAVDMERDNIFNILQVRPITEQIDIKSINWDTIDRSKVLISSDSSLGAGYIQGITDIIYVKESEFDKSSTERIAEEIGILNEDMVKSGRNYIIVGPGRWGSSDKWLGIPIKWNQISEAKVIVECGYKDFNIEPSQGTHFFQNITSLGIGYMTINPFRGDGEFNTGLLDHLESDYESKFLKRVRFTSPPMVYIDGKHRRGIIMI